MRPFVLLMLAMLSVSAQAGDTLPNIIWDYECRHIQKKAPFTCEMKGERMHIKLLKERKQMNKQESSRADYEFAKFIYRYFQLGGKRFEITAEWPGYTPRRCGPTPKRINYLCHNNQ